MEHEKLIPRERYLSRIRPLYDSNIIKAIVGPRRSGKSVVLSLIRKEIGHDDHTIYIDFEDMDNDHLRDAKRLHDTVKGMMKDDSRYYLFFDEIQNVKGFEKVIASLRNSHDCSIFVTGSNSNMLSGELSSALTGRCMEFTILPFSYAESRMYLENIRGPVPDGFIYDYVRCGGYPQRLQMPDEALSRKYLRELYGAILEKDIRVRHPRLDMKRFERVSAFVLANCGNDFSSATIAASLTKDGHRITPQTVEKYLDIMEQAFLIRRAGVYDIAGKNVLTYKPKNYATDNGMRFIVTNSIDVQNGYFLENIVYLELLSRGYEVYVGKKYNGEIDFVAVKDGRKCFIQVAYLMPTEETMEREFGAFRSVRDQSPKYVMSLDPLDLSRDGIAHINIEDFLLGRKDIHLT